MRGGDGRAARIGLTKRDRRRGLGGEPQPTASAAVAASLSGLSAPRRPARLAHSLELGKRELAIQTEQRLGRQGDLQPGLVVGEDGEGIPRIPIS